LWKQWGEIVGPTMSKVCEPVGYRKGVLIIWVQSSSWMQQMTFMIDPLKNKINTFLDRTFVDQIRFTLDRKEVPKDAWKVQELRTSIDKISK
jgi:predicted nucleic acid-binding Zn ribbon protein